MDKEKLSYFKHNRTESYLTPILRYYGREFVETMNLVPKLGVAVGNTESSVDYSDPSILYVLDGDKNPKYTDTLLDFLDGKPYMNGHYKLTAAYSSPIVVSIKIPEIFPDALPNFLKGKYSKMYTKDQIFDWFKCLHPLYAGNSAKQSNVLQTILVLDRDERIREPFIEVVNEEFTAIGAKFLNNVRSEDMVEDFEYDFPPNFEHEILNYSNEIHKKRS